MADGVPTIVLPMKGLLSRLKAVISAAREADAQSFIQLAPHQTWTWYALMLGRELEDTLNPPQPQLSPERTQVLVASAQVVIGTLRVLFMDAGLVPRPSLVIEILRQVTPTKLAFERLSYYIITELQAHLSAASVADGLRANLESLKPRGRRAPRKLSELPNPDAPPWASVNRMTSKKIQIPCRIDPAIKSLIEAEAQKSGVSQSRWLEEAIVERLQRQGHPLELKKAEKAPAKTPGKPRRLQRPSVPIPEKKRRCLRQPCRQVHDNAHGTELGEDDRRGAGNDGSLGLDE